jgi:hypothetical protein
MHDSIVVPSRRRSGGLWLLWTDELDISIQMDSFHLILAIAKDKSTNISFGLVCVYGDPYHNYTSTIWNQVADFANVHSNLPIVCLVDMNDIMYETEKSNDNVNYSGMAMFKILSSRLVYLILVIMALLILGLIDVLLPILYFNVLTDA